jgi:hypothetical protein
MIVDQLKRTAVEVRAGVSRDELALVVAETASLVEVLQIAGERSGVPPPTAVVWGLRGLRAWALAIVEAKTVPTARSRALSRRRHAKQ